MPWFRVDDKLHDHRKARRAKKAAMGVWVLAGSWAMDNLTDGFIPEDVLARWGNKLDARSLVSAGLWHPSEKNGETGWQFHNWSEFQPTRKAIEEMRRQKSEAGRKGGRNSGASRREAGAQAGASGLVEPESNPQSQSHTLSLVTSSSQSSSVARELDDDGLTRIRQALNNCPAAHARKTADFILAKAPGDVKRPVSYILKAIEDEPALYAYRRGNPTRAEECEIHAGEWADACRACAIDARLGGTA